MCAEVRVHGPEIVPHEEPIQLRSGRLSSKPLPRSRIHQLYQDHVCSAALRVAAVLIARLPIHSVLVTAVDDLLSASTGHLEKQTIVSVLVPRATWQRLDPERLDPSEALRNFNHRMDFKPSRGFAAVDPLELAELRALPASEP